MKTKTGTVCLLIAASIAANLLVPFATAGMRPRNHRQSQSTPLSNKDILDMQKMGISPEIIAAKIKSSLCDFDTSTQAMQELKAGGVPDAIILAMVQAPAVTTATPSALPSTSSPPISAKAEVTVSDGTQVEIELKKTVSSEEEKEGNVVDFAVIQPVVVDGITVIKQDAAARGHIAKAKKSGRWGRQGKLDWAMNDAVGVDGKRIALRFTKAARGDSSGGTVAVAAIATTVLLGPLGLLWGLKKGKPAIIPAGNRYTVFVHGNTVVKGELPPQANVSNKQPLIEADPRVQVPVKQKVEQRPPTVVNLPPFDSTKRKP